MCVWSRMLESQDNEITTTSNKHRNLLFEFQRWRWRRRRRHSHATHNSSLEQLSFHKSLFDNNGQKWWNLKSIFNKIHKHLNALMHNNNKSEKNMDRSLFDKKKKPCGSIYPLWIQFMECVCARLRKKKTLSDERANESAMECQHFSSGHQQLN